MNEQEYNKLTNKQKRVVLAQDVLDHLQSEKISPIAGAFFSLYKVGSHYGIMNQSSLNFMASDGYGNVGDSLQLVLQRPDTRCDVCAKGALFVAHVLRNNRVNLGDVYDHARLPREIQDVFGHMMLQHIEIAFEVCIHRWNDWHELGPYLGLDQDVIDKIQMDIETVGVYDFESKYNSDLDGIMRNIIRNEGQFVYVPDFRN